MTHRLSAPILDGDQARLIAGTLAGGYWVYDTGSTPASRKLEPLDRGEGPMVAGALLGDQLLLTLLIDPYGAFSA